MLYFLHLPKTAGTTLNSILRRVYGSPVIYLNYELRGGNRKIAETFAQKPPSERSRIRLISGHFSYGLDADINAPGPSEYFTFLRDPVDRVVSYYYYVQSTPDHHRHALVVGKSIRDVVSLTDSFDVDNSMCRMLSATCPPFGQCNSEIVDTAKANLSTFRSIGLMEDFNQSLVLLGHQLGWKTTPLYERLNATDRPKKSEVDSRDLDFIAERLGPDIELYNYAADLYRQSVARAGSRLHAKLTAFESRLIDLESYSQEQRHAALAEPEPPCRLTEQPARIVNKLRTLVWNKYRSVSQLIPPKTTA